MQNSHAKLWLKITCILLFVVFLVTFAASVIGILFLADTRVYFDGGRQLKEDAAWEVAYPELTRIRYLLKEKNVVEHYGINEEKAYQGDEWEYDYDIQSYKRTTLGITFNPESYPITEPEKYFGEDIVLNTLIDEYSADRTNYAIKIVNTQTGDVYYENFALPADYATILTEKIQFDTLGDGERINQQFERRYDLNNYLQKLNGGLYNSDIYYIPTEKFVSESQTPSERVWVVEGDYIPVYTQNFEISLYIPNEYLIETEDAFIMSLVNFAVSNRYLPIITGLVSLVLVCIIFIYLMCAAGRKAGVEGVIPNWIDKIPLDLYLVIITCLVGISLKLLDCVSGDVAFFIGAAVVGVFFIVLFISLCMTLATRSKLGTVLTNTLICSVIVLAVKLIKWLFRGLKKIFLAICYAFKNLKFVWRAVIVCTVVALFEFFTILFIVEMYWMRVFWMLVFLMGNMFLAVMAIFYLIAFFKIKNCIKELANGNSFAKVDNKYVFGVFRECSDDLNNIGLGIRKAVDESMKSERLKTELITNVSHDLKTPLTSIVNYVDILSKEDIQPEEAKEHVNVLVRQSQRMKKLIDDLIEASKASTGATKVELTRSDINMLLSQSLAEYEDRFNTANLSVKTALSETPLVADLDGKLMWRVFDNVLGNICKYAQPDTRVYVTATDKGNEAVVSFKNISKYELNITSDELMERFVRGDSSRSTEGSGLGLSIARSLCELQNATLDIDIDGDLFKVNITVPKLSDEALINE